MMLVSSILGISSEKSNVSDGVESTHQWRYVLLKLEVMLTSVESCKLMPHGSTVAS
jgi:hypothetical protein